MEAFKENPTFLSINLSSARSSSRWSSSAPPSSSAEYRVNSKEFFAQIKKLVTAGNIDRAIKLCDAGDYPTLQLVKAGLTHANKGPDEIDAAMSEKLGELKPAVEKRVGSLWSLGEHRDARRSPRNRLRSDSHVRRRRRAGPRRRATSSACSRTVSQRPCTTRPSVSASP